jgi:hypothetical protein
VANTDDESSSSRLLHLSTHADCSSSNATTLVTAFFFPSFRSTTSKSGGNKFANPVVSSGSGWIGAGFTGGMYAFTRGSLVLVFSLFLAFFCFSVGGCSSMGGWPSPEDAAAAAFRACFLRVAEDADEDDLPPLGIAVFEDGGERSTLTGQLL